MPSLAIVARAADKISVEHLSERGALGKPFDTTSSSSYTQNTLELSAIYIRNGYNLSSVRRISIGRQIGSYLLPSIVSNHISEGMIGSRIPHLRCETGRVSA